MQLSVLHIATISLSTSRYYHFNEPLRDPPGLLKVREVKKWYVELLMKLMERKGGYCDNQELKYPFSSMFSESSKNSG